MVSFRVIEEAVKICKLYGIQYNFVLKMPDEYQSFAGYAKPWLSQVTVERRELTNEKFMCVLFHEIQHCLNFRNKKFFKYHSSPDKKYVRQFGLRAELYTDKEAAKLAAKHGFFNYKGCYENNQYWKDHFKEFYG